LPHLAQLNNQPAGRIYVLLLDNGLFKVGKSFNFRTRLGQLRGEIRRFQKAEVVDGWYSAEHESYHASEVRLMAFCMEKFGGPVSGAEIFEGEYAAAVAHAEQLTAGPAPCLWCANASIEGASS
jgi:hypothetical protein